jgi:peptide/nickel transport system substrate-binding protein
VNKWLFDTIIVLSLILLLACSLVVKEKSPEAIPQAPVPTEFKRLTPNLVETSMPVYGGTLTVSLPTPRSFDGHQNVGYGPPAVLPTFNQLVMFDNTYKECVPETIIGDLAESWEQSQDGTEITFRLHQGVTWHDGMPFTADDVVYSLDKMTDPKRSAISERFPAYESTERTNDNTVKINLKYASAGFLLALANPDSVIQAQHLAGTDDTSADFMIGTGPWILNEYLPRVHLKYKRNPSYFKKDRYGNQFPYLDELYFVQTGSTGGDDAFVAGQLDVRSAYVSGITLDRYQYMKKGAPEALIEPKSSEAGVALYLNMKHKPLDDIRVRRAMGLIIDQRNLIVGHSGDPIFGIPGQGFLQPAFGLPKGEVAKFMGWDVPMEDRIAEAQRLMTEAGYADGFQLNMISSAAAGQTTQDYVGTNLVFADALRRYLKINCEIYPLTGAELTLRLKEDKYDIYTNALDVGQDPAQLLAYFGSGGQGNYSHYSNIDLDILLGELDIIINPIKRQEQIWEIERLLLTDLPALPTGIFPMRFMFYYPYVKNLRYMNALYSNVCRFEDVWIDNSIK